MEDWSMAKEKLKHILTIVGRNSRREWSLCYAFSQWSHLQAQTKLEVISTDRFNLMMNFKFYLIQWSFLKSDFLSFQWRAQQRLKERKKRNQINGWRKNEWCLSSFSRHLVSNTRVDQCDDYILSIQWRFDFIFYWDDVQPQVSEDILFFSMFSLKPHEKRPTLSFSILWNILLIKQRKKSIKAKVYILFLSDWVVKITIYCE